MGSSAAFKAVAQSPFAGDLLASASLRLQAEKWSLSCWLWVGAEQTQGRISHAGRAGT